MFGCKYTDCPNHPEYTGDEVSKQQSFEKNIKSALERGQTP
jgi:hypothetical protein